MHRQIKKWNQSCYLKIYSPDLKEMIVECSTAEEAVTHPFLKQDWVHMAHVNKPDDELLFIRREKDGNIQWVTPDAIP